MSTSLIDLLFSKGIIRGDSKEAIEYKEINEKKKRKEEFEQAIRKIETSTNFSKDDVLDTALFAKGPGTAAVTKYDPKKLPMILTPGLDPREPELCLFADPESDAVYYNYRAVTTRYSGAGESPDDKKIEILSLIVKLSANPKNPLTTLFIKQDGQNLFLKDKGYSMSFCERELRLIPKEFEQSLLKGRYQKF